MAQKKKTTTKKSTSRTSSPKQTESSTVVNKTTPSRAKSSQESKYTSALSKPSKNGTVTSVKKININKKKAIIIGIIVVAVAILYSLKGVYIAAMVDGQPISRLAVIHQLEQQGGKRTLDSLITQQLIENEANKRHIDVTQKDVDDQINKIETNLKAQGTSLDAALAQQGMSRTDLTQQVKLQIMVQKMVKPVVVTDKDITTYMDQNKSQLPQGGNQNQLKLQVKQQLEQEKQQAEIQDFVANLRKNAHITYFVNY